MSEDRSERNDARPRVIDYGTLPIDPRGKTSANKLIAWTIGGIISGLLILSCIIPSLGKVRPHAMKAKCASNLRYIGQGIAMYQYEHRVWPQTFADIVIGVDLHPEVFTCPEGDAVWASGSTIREAALTLTDPKHCSYIYFPPPSGAKMVSPEWIFAIERMENHNQTGMNVLFGDRRVGWLDKKGAEFVISELEAGHNPPRWPTTQPASAPGKQ